MTPYATPSNAPLRRFHNDPFTTVPSWHPVGYNTVGMYAARDRIPKDIEDENNMPDNVEAESTAQATDQQSRELPERIVIPSIKGEMVHLRPATIEDISRMDVIEAYIGASGITGKDRVAERGAVNAWVRRSVAWSKGETASESGVGDPEARRTIAWSIITESDHDGDGEVDAASSDNVIGMIFLIDIDGWARSARIQVVLGKDYRGRGYSRDIMPRVMTYGFAPEPAGLGMHRIWVAVPEQNTRSVSVYQSLGFMPSGRSRDALWNASQNRYQDLIVMDTLADEFDPIRSLDAFGMHVIEDNPGVKEALSAREHSIAIQLNSVKQDTAEPSASAETSSSSAQSQSDQPKESSDDTQRQATGEADDEWPYNSGERKTSKDAWWRSLDRGRKRDREGK